MEERVPPSFRGKTGFKKLYTRRQAIQKLEALRKDRELWVRLKGRFFDTPEKRIRKIDKDIGELISAYSL